MRLLLAALVAAGPALAQEADVACARLAEGVAEDLLPREWADEAESFTDLAEAGDQAACLLAFDLIRPVPSEDEGSLPETCADLRSTLGAEGVPDGLSEQLNTFIRAIAAGEETACAEGLTALTATRDG